MLFRITSRACWEKKEERAFQKHLHSGYLCDTVFSVSSFFMISKFVLNVPLKLCNIAPKRKQYIINFWAPRLVVEYFLLVRFQKVILYERILLCYCCFVEMIWIGQILCSDKSIWLACAYFKSLNDWIFQCELKKRNIKNFIRRCYICFIRLISSYIRHN